MGAEWMFLAEGVVQDARGVLSAVGINQNIQIAPDLPVTTKRAVVAYADLKDDVPEGQKFAVMVTVASPSGKTVFAQSLEGTVGRRKNAAIPATITVMTEFPFTVTEYGRHIITLTLQSSGLFKFESSVDFYVTEEL